MATLTKKEITAKTSTGKCFGVYTCQLEMNKNYTCEYESGKVFRNEGNNTFDTGCTVSTKKDFIDVVYRFENK